MCCLIPTFQEGISACILPSLGLHVCTSTRTLLCVSSLSECVHVRMYVLPRSVCMLSPLRTVLMTLGYATLGWCHRTLFRNTTVELHFVAFQKCTTFYENQSLEFTFIRERHGGLKKGGRVMKQTSIKQSTWTACLKLAAEVNARYLAFERRSFEFRSFSAYLNDTPWKHFTDNAMIM